MVQNARMRNQDFHAGPQIVTNSGHISRILQRLLKDRSLLSITLPGERGEFRSAVLEVQPRGAAHIVLDELNPERGHRLVQPGSALRIYCRANGVETRFVATVRDVGVDNGIHYYRADFPEEVYYHQRRQFVRVPIRRGLQEKITLTAEEETSDVELSDISAGGVGGYVMGGPDLVRGRIYDFSICLTNGDEFSGQMEIRFARQDKIRRRQRFGAQFMGLKPTQRTKIDRLVAALQRELLRTT
jgi:c-di-GMP-binding flagellar brake protein YcgR